MGSFVPYTVGILFVLPILALVGVLFYLVARLFIQWMVFDGTTSQPAAKQASTAKVTVKG